MSILSCEGCNVLTTFLCRLHVCRNPWSITSNSLTNGFLYPAITSKWGGVPLGPQMTGKLILAAWPNGDSIVSSLRLARSKSNPPEYTGDAKMATIKEGTYVNATHWAYTFLCTKCITESSLTFSASSASARLGWAMSSREVQNPGTSAAKLGMHNAGTGTFNIELGGAKHDKYGAWAGMAGV